MAAKPEKTQVPQRLADYFEDCPKAALAFSGGVDSAYLLWAARACGVDVAPYFASSAFQPAFEREDARAVCKELDVPLRVLELDVLAHPAITENPPNRCYHCKQAIFSSIAGAAAAEGYTKLLDGSNASDDAGDRPGMRALAELAVESPLRLAGLTKDEIRGLSRAAGLFTWDKPAYACLATRIPAGQPLEAALLRRVEKAETALHALGFSDLRVRVRGETAKIQIPAGQFGLLLERRQEILEALTPYFSEISLDLRPR